MGWGSLTLFRQRPILNLSLDAAGIARATPDNAILFPMREFTRTLSRRNKVCEPEVAGLNPKGANRRQ